MKTRSTAVALSLLVATAALLPSARSDAATEPQTAISASDEQVFVIERTLERFAAAGMELPPVTIEAFVSTEACRGNDGYATTGNGEFHVSICTEKRFERIAVHELAHIWADANLDEATRQAFMDFRGAESWNEGEWHEQASEQAAETITWVLLDGEVSIHTALDMRDAASLTTGFEILTSAGA